MRVRVVKRVVFQHPLTRNDRIFFVSLEPQAQASASDEAGVLSKSVTCGDAQGSLWSTLVFAQKTGYSSLLGFSPRHTAGCDSIRRQPVGHERMRFHSS